MLKCKWFKWNHVSKRGPRCLFIRQPRKISQPRNMPFELELNDEICQTSQRCCRGACHSSQRCINLAAVYGFETSLILATIYIINALASGRCGTNFKCVISEHVLRIKQAFIVKLLPIEWYRITHYKSTLVQVMAWCRQATSHYLSQHWIKSMCH